MQITELKEKLMTTPETIDLSTIIEIKPYLSHIEKKIVCDNIISASLNQNENGLIICDFYNQKLTTDISIIVNYTNIEISEDEFIEDYNYLCEQGIIKYVLNNMNKDEFNFIEDMVSANINQERKIGNSLESIIAKGINKLTDKLPTDKELKSLSKSLVKDLNKFDWNKIPMLKDMWLTANGKYGSGGDGK